MKLQVEWGPIIPLEKAQRPFIYSVDREKLPNLPGVYIFGRRRRDGGFEALYVGRANNIQGRVWGHRNHLRLMMHLEDARKGERVVRAGVFIARQGQNPKTCLPLIERALIRFFLLEGDDLVNKSGTRLGRHELTSFGKHPNQFVPKLMLLD